MYLFTKNIMRQLKVTWGEQTHFTQGNALARAG
jgi:hypothetical protein